MSGAYDPRMTDRIPGTPTGSTTAASSKAPPAVSAPSPALVLASFVPIGFALVLAVVAPGFFAPLLDDRVNVLGNRPLIPFAGALLGLLAINLLVIRLVRSSFVQGLVLALTTTAGVFLVILMPAFVLIAVNLGAID